MNRAVLLCAALGTGLGWAQAPGYQPPPYYQPQQQQPYYAPQQQQYYPPQQPYQQPVNGPRLSPQELSNLVAPIALYPDLLLSQVLAASTYPAEITQAQQWMQGNPGLRGPALVDAAKQQNWDPSVQALVAFPDVVNLLTRNIQWTTDLGNSFLSQQADVMDAIQRLRALAQNNGRLQNTPQQRISYEQQNGQSAIVIQPTDPQVVYPPMYNPEYVWGPPVYGYYPPLGYPIGYGITYAVGTVLGALFTGLLSFGGWGWGLSWLGHGLFLNGLFFSHFGFHGIGGYGGGNGYAARSAWVHNSAHRLGVPYGGSRSASARYGGGANSARSFGGNYAARSYAGNSAVRSNGGNRQAEAYRGLSASTARSGGSYGSGYSQPRSYANTASRGNSSGGYAHSFGSGRGWSAPASQSHSSAPKASSHSRGGGGGGHSSGHGHSSGGHSSGGHAHGGGHKK